MSVEEVLNPFNLEKIGELQLVDEKQMAGFIESADQIANDRSRWIPKNERIEILKRLQEQIKSRRDDLIKQAASEGGKPFKDTVVEIDRGIDGVGVAIDEIKALAGHEIPMNINASSKGRMAITSYRPRGMVAAISAFNHPFNLIIHQAIPAVAAGCPVIVKPAMTTPLSCQSIVEMLYESGLPKEYCRLAPCSNEVAEKLVVDPANRFLTFIGSAKVGWYLRSKLPAGAQCALEHGGAAPVIVDESADLDSCIPLLVKGGFYHAGQVCVSVQRVFVHESIKDSFMDKFTAEAKKLVSGDPLKENTDVGPLILPREVERVDQWVKEAVDHGANCVMGGEKISETVYSPTVLTNVNDKSTISNNEVFGPVVNVNTYKDFGEAIQRANNVPFAFQASVFTNKLENALLASQELEGLAIMINDHTAFRVDWMPFGGYKQSGLGVGGIGHSIRDMSIEKMTVFKSNHLL